MSTETANILSETLSPAEQAYFSSKGSDMSGFKPDDVPGEAASSPTPANGEAQPSSSDRDGAAPVNADDVEGVYIDADGKARSVITGKFVPHAALHQERERRKAAERSATEMRESYIKAQERLAVLNEVLMQADQAPAQNGKAEAPAATEPPDPEEDIFAHVKWQKERIKQLEEAHKQARQSEEHRNLSNQVQSIYQQDAHKFMQANPDFSDAYSYLGQSYRAELKALGRDDRSIEQAMQAAEQAIVLEALRNQRSPAQVIYEHAKARGYARKDAAQQPAQNNSEDAKKKLETIQRAQAQTASLSKAGGSSGEGLTIENLADMSEEEFAAVYQKLGKAKIKQYLGG